MYFLSIDNSMLTPLLNITLNISDPKKLNIFQWPVFFFFASLWRINCKLRVNFIRDNRLWFLAIWLFNLMELFLNISNLYLEIKNFQIILLVGYLLYFLL